MLQIFQKTKRYIWRYILVIPLLTITTIAIVVWSFPNSVYSFLMKIGVSEGIVATVYQDNAEILYKLGSRHLGGAGEYDLEKAALYIEKAINLDATLPYAHYQQARIHFLHSRYKKALESVDMQIQINPDFSRSYYLRGLINGYDKNLHAAAGDFSNFIKREPEEWAGYADLAWILFQLGDFEGVKERMEDILARTKNAWLLNAYGVALLNLNEYEGALIALLEAKDLASRMTPEMWGMAYVGNDPRIYDIGLHEMRRNIDENIESVNNALSKK